VVLCADSDKVHTWVKRSWPLETTQSTSSWSDGAGAGASAESDGCPRNVDACSLGRYINRHYLCILALSLTTCCSKF